MSYPTLEQYNEALQHPQVAFSDPDLANGKVAVNGFGLPVAMCGGFALTYGITSTGGRKYAVRCFHKKSNSLEIRYDAISRRIKSLNSKFFVNFDFQHSGIRIAGSKYPIVKMEWATGTTLGEFLERHHTEPDPLQALGNSLLELSTYLEANRIAHGDIQPENVMASDSGRRLQLIDYDGMYVDELSSSGASELGQRNFQHPKRSNGDWGTYLDRFSFILLHVALKALKAQPTLWEQTQSDGGAVIFRAHDLANPAGSRIFDSLIRKQEFGEDVRNLARICDAPYESIPSLSDFIAGRNIPAEIIYRAGERNRTAVYIGAYPVLSAEDYPACHNHIGDVVELVGQIIAIKSAHTKYGKPYVFLNFGDWRGNIVKITIWAEGLDVLAQKPDDTWIGKWVSVVGMMDPPFVTNSYTHLSITITKSNQIQTITHEQAKFRLGSGTEMSTLNPVLNRKIADEKSVKDGNPVTLTASARHASIPNSSSAGGSQPSTTSKNQKIIRDMLPGNTSAGNSPPISGPPKKSTPGGNGCIVVVVIILILIFIGCIMEVIEFLSKL